MKRLWLLEARGNRPPGGSASAMAMEVKAEDAAVGAGIWQPGYERGEGAYGLVAKRIATQARASDRRRRRWRVEAGRDGTLAVNHPPAGTLKGTDIQATLPPLGFRSGDSGCASAAGCQAGLARGPSADFMSKASGQITVDMKNGQVLDVEPGRRGRLLGLLSVTALPRRLALDFRDVFNEGMAFDAIKGDFRIGSGSAYTCNLGLTGPVADVGIVGRTGLGNRDYEQLAVVRPKVSNMLTVGGVVLGGPVGGVTIC